MSEIMRAASNAIRGVIITDPGYKLVVSDLSNIEGRTLAWLAGEEWKLQAFRAFDRGDGHDLYVMAYSRSFNVTPEAVIENKKNGDGTWRQVGKVQELALGYQGSTGAFLTMGALYGIDMPEEDALRIVRAWRKAHPNIRAWWYELETAAKDAIKNEGVVIPCRKVSLCRTGAWLRILLPSGRELCYVSPTISGGQKCPDCDGHGHVAGEKCETCFGRGKLPEQLSYMGVCTYTKTWRRIYTYGGKLAENITQAVARDVMADRMPAVAQAGFQIILTVHDELITEAPDTDDYTHERLSRLLSQQPVWALDLPLAAGGFQAYRYRKD